MSKKTVLTLAIVGVLVVFVFVVAAQASKPKLDGDTISKTFSQGAPCATTVVALKLPAESDASKVSEQLFAALQPIKGMNSATLNVSNSSLEVGFCESSASPDTIHQALLATGLVAEVPATQSDTVD